MHPRAPGDRLMTSRHALDLSRLPQWGYGAASPVWWGTMGFMAVEGMGFALAVGRYASYAEGREPPPPGPVRKSIGRLGRRLRRA